jgi:hypothetical protein
VIRYADHFWDRMAERNVTEEDVVTALHRRIRETPGPPGGIWIWGYTQSGRILKVGVRATDHQFVVTVWWADE